MRTTPDNISYLKIGEVFVFGSNTAGIHAAGASRKALEFGAQIGVGVGLMGRTYAIPTQGRDLMTLPIPYIADSIRWFFNEAKLRSEYTYLVTKIGCGIAGYTTYDIAPLFWPNGWNQDPPSNIILPKEFWDVKNELSKSKQTEMFT